MKVDLRQPNLRKVPIGTIVITTKGFEFQKCRLDSWKDLTSGLLWHDTKPGKYTHHEAVEKFGGKLPTIQEFEVAEKHGFREVLPNIQGYWFWSSSLYSYNTDVAMVFSGFSGVSGDGFRDFNGSVRCVGR